MEFISKSPEPGVQFSELGMGGGGGAIILSISSEMGFGSFCLSRNLSISSKL